MADDRRDKTAAALCECGCGKPVSISKLTDTKRGRIKGQPMRFVIGHGSRTQRQPKRYREVAVAGGSKKGLHVVIAERALGRPLRRPEEVHHVDEDKSNNAPSNLVICQDRAYHMLLHVRTRVLRAGGDPNTQRMCCVCKQLKPLKAFSTLKTGVVHGQCLDCGREYNRRRTAERLAS